MDRPVRKSPRLKGYDYSLCGAYFLTICTNDFKHLFGNIEIGLHENHINLSDVGAIIQKNLESLHDTFPEFENLHYAIMPNHIISWC
jgi:REP element-mobilizing transposase RayT